MVAMSVCLLSPPRLERRDERANVQRIRVLKTLAALTALRAAEVRDYSYDE